MKLYPELKKKIEHSSDPLETAVRFAIAGNIIDFGVNSQLDESIIYKTLDDSMKNDLFPLLSLVSCRQISTCILTV